ncbi:hypothetical protein BJY16_005096 [Actinoplanes octamycinicus]|uniref:DUF6199 domain-containing protein n=1 Tax=Actinoplanes octamycinicus TaxID=135948 RepID=A0A7W7H0R0_9ACTN|nr:hypothetical protein [Actinoplanes octamycinicus]MBB4741637.1 hypothetical protein [Actinoplanes octamycinicus]
MARLLCLVPFLALLLWGAISPRSQWLTLSAWRFRHPEANEPSDAAYAWTRASNILGVVLLVCAGIGLADASRDRGPGAGPTPAATATTTFDYTTPAALLVDFGVQQATVVTVPRLSAPPGPDTAQPVAVVRRRAVDAAFPPPYLPRSTLPGGGNWLLLGVRGDSPPVSVTVREAAGAITVGVFGACAGACSAVPVTGGATVYLVPVELAAPLAGRAVIDQATGDRVP